MAKLGQSIGLLSALTRGETTALVEKVRCSMAPITFDVDKFNDLIDEFGVEMKYYAAVLCSCVYENDGQPDPNCDCYAGFRYPNNPKVVKLLRTSVNFNNLPEQAGMILQGGCQITIPRCYKNGNEYLYNSIYDTVSVGDIFVITNRPRRDRDILQKGVKDTISAFDVQEIVSITKKAKKYRDGIDYRLNTYKYPLPYWYVGLKDSDADLSKGEKLHGGEIDWLIGGESPNDDEFYTVEFLSKIQYVVWQDLAKDRGSDTDLLPKRILCTLRQYVDFGSSQLDSINI